MNLLYVLLDLIIEKTQEKIFEQSDKIETFEHDFSEMKMENQRMSEELEVLRVNFAYDID